MFDAAFYSTVLPERVMAECRARPDDVPVVVLHLANGKTLDLCHIVHLGERWLAVQHFRDSEACTDMDVAFLPYELVAMVTVSLHHPSSRRAGFTMRAESGPAVRSETTAV